MAPLLLLEPLSYWHALNGHSSVPISGSARVEATPFLSFFITLFIHFYFAIDLNGEMLIGQNESHDYSADFGLKIVRQWNEMIKLMICVGPDARM